MLYPPVKPTEFGHLELPHGQKIYWEALGSKAGEPIVMLHGGPGAGCSPMSRRFFDLKKYRVILWDQRGCGRSALPQEHLSDQELKTARREMLKHLSFDNMILDMEALRAHLKIERWSVFGGSWGTTLALGYAQRFPERVNKLLLRGVFTSTQEEINWLYSDQGAAQMFPLEWERFYGEWMALRQATGPNTELTKNPNTLQTSSTGLQWREILSDFYQAFCEGSQSVQERAALAWGQWEQSIMSLEGSGTSGPSDHQRNFEMGLISCHLFLNDPLLTSEEFWHQMPLMAHLPCDIVQGQFDAVTPAKTAWRLSQMMNNSRLQLVRQAGHASSDPQLTQALVRVLDAWVF